MVLLSLPGIPYIGIPVWGFPRDSFGIPRYSKGFLQDSPGIPWGFLVIGNPKGIDKAPSAPSFEFRRELSWLSTFES